MGIKNFQNNAPEKAPQSETVEIELLPGEQNQSFQEVENLRKQFDQSYQQYRLRGGSLLKQTLDGTIITTYGFSASVNNVQKDFVAVHTATGSVYLGDKATHIDPVTPAAAPKIFDAVFSTTTQINFINSGNFLYIFDVSSNVKKVYDLEKSTANDWMNHLSGSIIDYSWNEFTDWREDNIWGFEEGQEIIALNSFSGGEYATEHADHPTMISFVTKIESVFSNYFTYQDPNLRQWNSNFDVSIGTLPNSADLAEYIGINGNVLYDPDEPGTNKVVNNPDFEVPVVFRGYLIVDLLSDGSLLTPGKPITVSTSFFNANRRRPGSIEFTITPASNRVEKRFLYCTRWQINQRNVFNPSRPKYDNSAFFFAKEIEKTQGSFNDKTPDNLLFSGISARLPYRAGVLQMFGKGQLDPYSVASIRNNLLIAGYRVNRPVPEPYSNIVNPDEKNIQVQIRTGTDLTAAPKVAFIFEYTDGKKSGLVEFPTVLTDSTQTLDPGGDGTYAFGDIEISIKPTGAGDITFEDDADPLDSVTIAYTASDEVWQVAARLRDAINGFTWDIAITATVVGAGDVVRIKADAIGNAGNSLAYKIFYDATIILNDDSSGSFTLQLSGGSDPIAPVEVSGNDVTIHSLNALVSSIYVIITRTALNPKIFHESQDSNSHFHGRLLLLPNSDAEIDALEDFILPPAGDVREAADLYDWMVSGVPFQQILVSDQARIRDSAIIKQVIPTQFDVDKTQMRQRVVIFTDRNIQVGYLLISSSGVDYEFEVIGEGSALKNRFSAWFVEGNIIYQASDGIYRLSESEYTKIIDRYQYDTLENNLHCVLFNRHHKEYWLFFPGEKVIVTSASGEIRCRFSWPVAFGDVSHGTYIGDKLLLGIGDKLYAGDVDGVVDVATNIDGHLITQHIGDATMQAKIMEVAVAGQDLSCEVSLDLQKPRLEKNTSAWSAGFTEDVAAGPKPLYMHRTPFTFAHRGVMPKGKIKVTGDNDGFISHIHLTYIAMENKGKARY